VTEVKLRRGEPVEKALRRLKKKLDKEGIMREIRSHRHYEKPSEKRRRKAARARTRPY
jgi:small subunit ribosomal protein S21